MPHSIIGVEVSKTSVLCCPLDEVPPNAAAFARSYTPVVLQSNADGVKELLALGDQYVIEPTGDYSKIWIDTLRANNKQVLRVNPTRVRALKEYSGISSKTDRYDAAFLAIYGAMNQGNPYAFLSDYAEDLREAVLHHQYLTRMTGNFQRRLWQLLSHEWPEACQSRNGTKPQQRRLWMESSPPALWRFIAGEPVRGQKVREEKLLSSVGSGLSGLSRALAAQICELERQQFIYEERIVALLGVEAFKGYHAVFDRFGFGELTRAAILARIYPFQQFLDANGQSIREKRPSANGRYHRRNRSLGAFRLSLGNGTKVYQSGQLNVERAAGSKMARSALFLHVKARVVILGARSGLSASDPLKQHIAYYQSLGQMPHRQAVLKVVSRVVKDLYRELANTSL